MSKLEKLIKDLCPNGVVYKTIGELATYRRGSFPQPYTNSSFYGGEDAMPFVQVADIEDEGFKLKDKTKQTISKIAQPKSIFVPKGTVLCSIQGTIGRVAITQYDSYVDRTIAIFESLNNEIDKKFFAYCIEVKFKFEKQFARGSTLKTITKEEFTKFSIPVPPLKIQYEIVSILDRFNSKIMELNENLEKELVARKKQYGYYKEKLLNDNSNDKVRLGDYLLKIENIKWKQTDKEYLYIDLSSVDRDNHIIVDTKQINTKTAPSRAQQIIKMGDILFGGTRPMLKRSCIVNEEYNNQICSTGFCVLRANPEKALPKWIYFMISTDEFYNYVEKNQKGASYPAISDGDVKNYMISLPTLEKQKEIVDLLDKLEKNYNNIFNKLPAEIEKRKTQYEYYREKLLSFKEVEINE